MSGHRHQLRMMIAFEVSNRGDGFTAADMQPLQRLTIEQLRDRLRDERLTTAARKVFDELVEDSGSDPATYGIAWAMIVDAVRDAYPDAGDDRIDEIATRVDELFDDAAGRARA
ncbi:MAG: hypothetical protein ACU85V_00155 [Gammaproteobacteria bacterium]